MRRINLLRGHGSPTNYQYSHHGCRCVACRGATRAYHAAYEDAYRDERHAYYAAYRATHREERAEYSRRYYAEHPEEAAERHRGYCASHREELNEYQRLCCAKHPKKRAEHAERGRKYRAEHPEEIAERNRNRRALEANATGTHSAADVRAQYERQHGKCFWRTVNPDCIVSLEGGYHADHVIPLAGDRTSSNGPENIVLSCPRCNGSKHAKDPMDWAGVMF